MNDIEIGSRVSFICKPFAAPHKFPVVGFVEDIKLSTFGAKRKGWGATILVSTDEYLKWYPGKRRTFIALDKLTIETL